MASLAQQLAGIASADASRLTSKFGAPSSKSYLFPPTIAAEHDLDAIFSLGQSGFEELLELDPLIGEFEDKLFSEHSKRTDRMLLNQEENRQLDISLQRCLRRLGKWIGIMAGGKCIEWLVRRFRIHEMNAEILLQVFLPYHDSPNFTRMLAILNLPPTSPYHAPFTPLIQKAQPVPRSYITSAISPARDSSLRLLSDIADMVRIAHEEKVVHRALLTFWTSVMVDLLEKSKTGKGVSEGLVKVLVEAFVTILSISSGGPEINAAVYPPLVLLTRTTALADGPFAAILSSLLTRNSGANASQRVLTLLVILDSRHGWEGGLGEDAATRLQGIAKLGDFLVAAMEKYGFEQAMTAVVTVMLDGPEKCQNNLTTVLDYPFLPASLVKLAAAKLLSTGTSQSASESTQAVCKTLLIALKERHPNLVDSAFLEIPIGPAIEDLLGPKSTADQAIVNVYSADVTTRVAGINAMYELIDTEGWEGIDSKAIEEALSARLSDTEVPVIQALLSKPNILISLWTQKDGFIELIAPAFNAAQPDRPLLTMLLEFVAKYLLRIQPQHSLLAFQKLFFPCLLGSEKRQAFGEAEWEVISTYGKESMEILQRIAMARKGPNDGEESGGYNLAVAKALSESIVASDDFEKHVAFLLTQLVAQLPSAKLLAHLVLANLVQTLRGDHQIAVAVRVLEVLRGQLSTASFRDHIVLEDVFSPKYLKAIVEKPDSPQTTQRATLSLLSAMTKVVRPFGLQVDWLAEAGTSTARKSNSFATFSHLVYTWANNGNIPSELSKALLRALLIQLGEDSLVFFVSVWTTSAVASLRVAALRHASAFISACAAQRPTDFQMILPAILLALMDEEKAVRAAAAGVLKAISGMTEKSGSDIYALDTLYGDRSKLVQLLKQADLKNYLQALVAAAEDCVIDPKRLRTVQTAALDLQHGEGKKESSHRRAVIGFLLSHVSAWRAIQPRQNLLSTLSEISDTSVLKGVLPLLMDLNNQQAEETAWVASLPLGLQSGYLTTLFSALNKQSASVIATEDVGAWKFVVSLLRPAEETSIGAQLRSLSIARMIDGVFAVLAPAEQMSYVTTLIESLPELPTDDAFTSKAALEQFPLDPLTIIATIQELAQPLESSTAHRKKQKQDETGASDKIESAVTNLTVLIESRDWKTVSGNALLVSALMSILSNLLSKRQSIREGADYLEQEVLSAILVLVEKIQDPNELTKAHVGIEVIIKVIRASTNPRTSERALLVASELARLIPDAVLHNVMPIFTFMGASDFQRDDAYSFGVVEKTVSRIVPVMTQSLRDKASTKLELYNESLTFISIFTDMASRLPKHRTLPFFVHLVKSLGPADFLAPVTMLLVDRGNTKAGKSKDGVSPMELPLGVAAAFELDVKLGALSEVVQEVARLVSDISAEEKTSFLGQIVVENGDLTVKRINALLSFSNGLAKQLTGRACEQSVVEDIVQQLILLAASTNDLSLKTSDVPAAVQTTLSASMQLLSVESFLSITQRLLTSGSALDPNMALDVFTQRLPLVKSDLRTRSAPIMAEIVRQSSLRLSSTTTSTPFALRALGVIVATALPSEDAALTQVIPKLVEAVKNNKDVTIVVSTLSLLESTCRQLRSRIIPSLQSIVEATLHVVKSAQSTATTIKQSFSTLSAVVETVPVFISASQLSTILQSVIDVYSKQDSAAKVLSVVAKKIPTKTLFPTVMELWKTVQKQDESAMKAFFDLLRLTLRNADRKALPTLVKPVFAFFLDVFDLRHRLQSQGYDSEVVDVIENSAIGSFLELVTKLNEATFKPLFIRLYDWAVIDKAEDKPINDPRLVERMIVLLHVMMGLLEKFRHLLSPYIGTLLPHIEELLPAYADETLTDLPLWTLLLDVLSRSYEVDEGAYWTDALNLRLIPLLVAQLSLFPEITSSPSSPVSNVLASLAASTTSESVLRKLNQAICMATRAEEPKARMAALRAMDLVWEKQADEMLQFVPETVSEFLAELLEDENGEVEGLARKVLARIEALTGSLKEYLE
ncbi:U3 small nucleolar RNA-associated protein 10, partial [Tremellales sp. Uapishka_1]